MRPAAAAGDGRPSAPGPPSPGLCFPSSLLAPTFPLYGLRRPALQLRPPPPPAWTRRRPSWKLFCLSCLPRRLLQPSLPSCPGTRSRGLRGHSAPSEVPRASADVPSPSRRVPCPDARLAGEPRSCPAAAAVGAPDREGQRRARPRPRRAARAHPAAGNLPSPRRVALTQRRRAGRAEQGQNIELKMPRRWVVGRTGPQESKTQEKIKIEIKDLLGLLGLCFVCTRLAVYLPPSF